MLSHQPEVSRLIHHERVQQLADDAQQPMQSVSLPSHSFGLSHVLARLVAFAHLTSAPHQRRVDISS